MEPWSKADQEWFERQQQQQFDRMDANREYAEEMAADRLTREHDDGDHYDDVPGCPICDREVEEAVEALSELQDEENRK